MIPLNLNEVFVLVILSSRDTQNNSNNKLFSEHYLYDK